MEYSEIAMQQVRQRRLIIDQVDLWLLEELRPYLGQRVLEIGCGLGNFARHLIDRDLYVGIDISQESVDHLNAAYADYPNMHAIVADVTDPRLPELLPCDFDTALSVNVFEHLEDDLSALRNVRAALKSGRIILVVPAHNWLYGSMDRSIGHYRRYTKKSMAALLSAADLKCVHLEYLNFLGALGWLVNGRLLRQSVPPSGQLKFINLIIPFVKRLEKSIPVPFGVSLLAVAQVG